MVDRHRLGRRNKRAGANFESRVRAYLRRYGWYVQRNTFGLYDIVAVPPRFWNLAMPEPLLSHFKKQEPLLLQPTRSKYPPRQKLEELKLYCEKWIGSAYLVQPDYSVPRHPLVFTPTYELGRTVKFLNRGTV